MNPIRSIIVLALLALAFVTTSLAQTQTKPKRNLLFIGQSKGYQHETISTAMATFYNLGRSSGLWSPSIGTPACSIELLAPMARVPQESASKAF